MYSIYKITTSSEDFYSSRNKNVLTETFDYIFGISESDLTKESLPEYLGNRVISIDQIGQISNDVDLDDLVFQNSPGDREIPLVILD